MSPEPDRQLVARLVEENLGWLRGWFRGRVKDPDLTDELCQESFLRALRRISGLRDVALFPGWLYRIAENTLRDHLRAKIRRKKVVFTPDLEEAAHPEAPAFDPRDPEKQEETERLLAAIRELPPKLREPLLLRHSRDLPYREIAAILGIRENAVQVRIFRARRLLRRKLKDMEP